MTAQIRLAGLFQPDRFSAWSTDTQQKIRRGAAAGLRDSGILIRDRLRRQMRSAFKIKRPAFVNVMTYRLFDQKPAKLPALLVGALKAPWLESHEIGATIRGRGRGVLIPLFARIGRKRFRKIVDGLIRQGNASFVNVNGSVILFAENIPESSPLLAGVKRSFRKATGTKRLKRGIDIPIAVLVPQVKLPARLKVQETVRNALPLVADAIEKRLRLN